VQEQELVQLHPLSEQHPQSASALHLQSLHGHFPLAGCVSARSEPDIRAAQINERVNSFIGTSLRLCFPKSTLPLVLLQHLRICVEKMLGKEYITTSINVEFGRIYLKPKASK
jgi:hypothetical protein